MSDDLVKRLLSEADYAAPYRAEQLRNAADRIEELESKLERACAYIERDAKMPAAAFGPNVNWRDVAPHAAQIVAELTENARKD